VPGSGEISTPREEGLEQLLASLSALIHEQVDAREPIFNEGCEQAVIDELEAATNALLPTDYKTLLRHADGSRDELTLTFPPGRLSFLSADEVFATWRYFAENPDDEFFDELTCDDKVRSVLMHPGRIPIAQNESGGRYLCIDLVPGPRGKVGQLVLNINEADCIVLEESLTALVRRYVTALETEQLKIERVPSEYLGLYWFTSNGKYVDHDVYRSLGT
jgi:cell wall assembly regulator SMI1